jgi:CheY-like chemotaxis protein
VLIVEDDTANRVLLREVCLAEGFHAEGVENGVIALQRLLEEPWDLVLTDGAMPEMSGFELIEQMRQRPALAEIPSIMISANIHGEPRRRAEELGVAAFIEKPFRLFDLTQRMRVAIRQPAPESDPPRPSVRIRHALVANLPHLPPPAQLRPALGAMLHGIRGRNQRVVCAVLRLEGGSDLTRAHGRSVADAAMGAMVVKLRMIAGGLDLTRSDDFELCLYGTRLENESIDDLPAVMPIVRDEVHTALGARDLSSVDVIAGVVVVGPLSASTRVPDPDQVLRGARELSVRARNTVERQLVEVLILAPSDSGKPQPPT